MRYNGLDRLTLSSETAMQDRSPVRLRRISTQVGITNFRQMVAKKKNMRMVMLQDVPAKQTDGSMIQ